MKINHNVPCLLNEFYLVTLVITNEEESEIKDLRYVNIITFIKTIQEINEWWVGGGGRTLFGTQHAYSSLVRDQDCFIRFIGRARI